MLQITKSATAASLVALDPLQPVLLDQIISAMPACTGFVWQGLGSREATGAASVRRLQELRPRQAEPVPAGSKAETVSTSGSTPGTAYLRAGVKLLRKSSRERGGRVCEKPPCRHHGDEAEKSCVRLSLGRREGSG